MTPLTSSISLYHPFIGLDHQSCPGESYYPLYEAQKRIYLIIHFLHYPFLPILQIAMREYIKFLACIGVIIYHNIKADCHCYHDTMRRRKQEGIMHIKKNLVL